MEFDELFQRFIERLCQVPLPDKGIQRVRTFMKEFAEGALEGFWSARMFSTIGNPYVVLDDGIDRFTQYIATRWNNKPPPRSLLESMEYLRLTGDKTYEITPKAYALVEQVDDAPIFISYRQEESSALALAILWRMEMKGLKPFVDMAMVAGDDWRQALRDRIVKSAYVVVLLSKETLTSDAVKQELHWAIEANTAIIPVWHNEFKFVDTEWISVPADIRSKVDSTHAIRVFNESALGYNNAIVELLNRFGVTP